MKPKQSVGGHQSLGDISPTFHQRQASQNTQRISEVLVQFKQEETSYANFTDLKSRFSRINEIKSSPSLQSVVDEKQLQMHQENNRVDIIEDIADDSEEEKSIKEQNMQEIKVLQTGGRGNQSLGKNFSEHDFLHKEILKKGKSLITGHQSPNKIQLIVRIRPFLISEQIKECLKVVNDNGIKLFKEFHQINFKFDNILMPKDTQDSVFSKVSNIVLGFLMGINGTIFAYGQTGAGKTYSITGGDSKNDQLQLNQKRGILPRTLDMIFEKLMREMQDQAQIRTARKSNIIINLYVSFYEIYNEKIHDLLYDEKSNQKQQNIQFSVNQKRRSHSRGSQQPKDQIKMQNHLDIREEKDGRFSIPDLKKVHIQSLEEAYEQLEIGLARRATSSTSLNNQSSRSHSVFQIYLEKTNTEGICVKSKMRIVDLAGSEKYTIKKDLPVAEKNVKVQELTSINSSLSALGQCISALSDSLRKHIPYRNSKLTKILKDSLDENSNLALIICISPSDFSGNSESLNTILKAYQEEKAIRKELEHYVMENNNAGVMEELSRLKKQNEELQNKVNQLEKNQVSPNQIQSKNSQKELSNILLQQKKNGAPLKSCLKKQQIQSQQFGQSQQLININIIKIREDQDLDNLDEDDQSKKRVKFAEKLDNDQSLDSDDRERIEHNLKYNDDTIFDNISIFQDLNNSGLVTHRLKDRKDVHPSKLKQLPIEEEDEEDEKEQNDKSIKIQIQLQHQQIKQEEIKQKKSSLIIAQIPDQNIKQFWGVESSNKNTVQQRQEYDIKQDSGVSPIQKRKPNNSSQDMSKDLIDLDNDGEMKNLDAFEVSKISHDNQGFNTQTNKQDTFQNFEFANGNQPDYNQSIFDAGDLFTENDQKMLGSKQFFNDVEEGQEGLFSQNYDNMIENDQRPQDDLLIEQDTENNQQISDSMMGLNAALETDNIPSIQIINNSQEIQNTLLLDSQSMIIDDPIKDQSLSQQMIQQIDASSIINLKDEKQGPNSHFFNQPNFQFFSAGNNQLLGQFQILQGGQISNANSSNMNTDVLTYSLTNTFSTIESLHDELTAIRNGLELSQKRGANILKTIHYYAREIEDQKPFNQDQNRIYEEQKYIKNKDISEQKYIGKQLSSNKKNNVDIYQDDDSSQFDLESLNINFVRDIKGFYSRIHQEIAQLKTILVDSASQHNNDEIPSHQKQQETPQIVQQAGNKIENHTPGQSKYSQSRNIQSQELAFYSEAKDNPLITQSSAISIEGIEKTQEIILELRKEMEVILNINQAQNSYKRRRNDKNKTQKSIKITPHKSTSHLLRLSSESKTSKKDDFIDDQNHSQSLQNQITSQKFKDSQISSSSLSLINSKEGASGSEKKSHNRMSSHKFEYNYDVQSSRINPFNEDQSRSVFQIDRIQADPDLPLFLDNQQNISKVMVQQVDLSQIAIDNQPYNLQSIIDTKTLIQYEEMPSESVSPPSHKNQIEPQNNNDISQNQISCQHSRQRTPEIFKSLAKLDESDIGLIIDREILFPVQNINQQMQVNKNFQQSQIPDRNTVQITQINNFFSQNSQFSNINHNYGPNSQENPDLQITLRSYNFNELNNSNLNYQSNQINYQVDSHSQNNQGNRNTNHGQEFLKTRQLGQNISSIHQQLTQTNLQSQPICNLNNSDFEQNPLIINNLSTIDRKKSIIGSKIENIQTAADNTLTLIFDSDEEQEFQGDQENDDKFGGEPIVQEVEEDDDVGIQSKHSLLFNADEDSQIEKNSSQENNSQGINNNLITSNSFQGDNSLLILANNFGNIGNNKVNLSGIGRIISNIFEQNSQEGQNNSSQMILKNSISLSKSIDDVTPERKKESILKLQNQKTETRKNQKYLLPQQHKLSSDIFLQAQQIQNPSLSPLQANIIQTQLLKERDQNNLIPMNLISEDISNEESRAITSFSQERAHKSTSKTSVQKYWNQFFNNKADSQNLQISEKMNSHLTINYPLSLQTPQSIYGQHNQVNFNQPHQPPLLNNQSSLSMNMSTSMDQIPSEQISNSKLLHMIQPTPTTQIRNIGGLNQVYSHGLQMPQFSQNSLPTTQFNSLSKTKEQMHHPSQSLGGLSFNPSIQPAQKVSQQSRNKQNLHTPLQTFSNNQNSHEQLNKGTRIDSFQKKRNSGVQVSQKQKTKDQKKSEIVSTENPDKNSIQAQGITSISKRKFSHGYQRL